MIGSKELFLELQEQMANEITNYENGNISVLDCLISLKEKKTVCENILNEVKEFESKYIDEITFQSDQYKERYNGFKIEVRNGRKNYDFSKIKEIIIAESNVKELKDYYKKAYEMKMKGVLMASEDGEEIELPEMSVSKSSVIVKAIS